MMPEGIEDEDSAALDAPIGSSGPPLSDVGAAMSRQVLLGLGFPSATP